MKRRVSSLKSRVSIQKRRVSNQKSRESSQKRRVSNQKKRGIESEKSSERKNDRVSSQKIDNRLSKTRVLAFLKTRVSDRFFEKSILVFFDSLLTFLLTFLTQYLPF